MRRSGPRQNGNDAAQPQGFDTSLRVIGPVGLGPIRTLTGSSALAGQRRNRIDQRSQLLAIRAIGRGECVGQRDPLGICREVVFAAGLESIRRVGAGLLAPPTARTDALAIRARDQSIWFASCSISKRTRCRPAQIPAFCQSRNRLQQVMPQPQPISRGKSSQGMPVLSTKRMPVSVARLETSGRPPLGYVRGRGNPGSMTDQSSSVSKGLAMNASSMTSEQMTPSLIHRQILKTKMTFC